MLTEIYIEALLVDEEMVDLVWELWSNELISDETAAWVWWCIFKIPPTSTGKLRSDLPNS